MQVRIIIRDVSGKNYKSAWMPATQSQYDNMIALFKDTKNMNNFTITIRNTTVYFVPTNIASATVKTKGK